LKFGKLVGIHEYWGSMQKFVRYGASGETGSSQFLFWEPLHISETNRARR